jgi:hypothetical protein
MQPCRNTIQHPAYRRSVRLTERGETPFISERICHTSNFAAAKIVFFPQLCKKNAKKYEYFWSYQKKAVLLQPVSNETGHIVPLAIALGSTE